MSAMQSDADLLRGIRARDAEAAAALYDRYAPRLFAVALRVTGERDAAAAAVEGTFIALMNGSAPAEAGEGWLIRSTRDLALGRESQTAPPSVESNVKPDAKSVRDPDAPTPTPTPRALVEEAFYRGSTVARLAATYGHSEPEIRSMLLDGIASLRRNVAGAANG